MLLSTEIILGHFDISFKRDSSSNSFALAVFRIEKLVPEIVSSLLSNFVLKGKKCYMRTNCIWQDVGK